MTEKVERTFTVAHSTVTHYRTKVTMDVPADIADDPTAVQRWLESAEAQDGNYQWTDAFDRNKDRTDEDATELDWVSLSSG